MDDEILTVDELAAMLKMPREAVYEMTRRRSQKRHANPLPVIRLGERHVRFLRSHIESWLARCAERGKSVR